MIDGIDYFPKRDKNKKGADQEWNELKRIKTAQLPKKNKIDKPVPKQPKDKPD